MRSAGGEASATGGSGSKAVELGVLVMKHQRQVVPLKLMKKRSDDLWLHQMKVVVSQ